jgi:hypothetical protein
MRMRSCLSALVRLGGGVVIGGMVYLDFLAHVTPFVIMRPRFEERERDYTRETTHPGIEWAS